MSLTDKETSSLERTMQKRDAIVHDHAVSACLAVLAKHFFMSNKDAKACRDEMQQLKTK